MICQNNIRTTIIITGLISLYSFSALSQQSINQDVKVVKEYNPTVSDAMKIEQMPELDDTTSYHPSFKYSILSRAFETANAIEPISPASMAKPKPILLNNSLAQAGIGTYNTFYGGLNYNILRTEKYALGLHAQHESSFGKLTLEDDSESETPYHDTEAGIRFKSFLDKVVLSSSMNFKHNVFDYYGYQSMASDTIYQLFGTNTFAGSEMMQERKQRLSNFDINLALSNTETKIEALQWTAGAKYQTFGNKTGGKQNMFVFTGKIHIPANNMYFNVDADIKSSSVTFPDSIGPMFQFINQKKTLISLLPRVGLQFTQGYVEAGMLFAGSTGYRQDGMHLAPHINATYTVAEGIVSIFGGISGKYNFNDYSGAFYENPFISPDVVVDNSFYGFNLEGGIKGNFSHTTSFTAKVDYSYFNDEHFYTNKFYLRDTIVPVQDYSNLFVPVYDNGSLLKVQGELLIDPTDAISLRISACYNGWNLENEKYPWHMPETEFGFFGKYKLENGLSFNTSINLIGKRYANLGNDNYKKLNSLFDVNMGASYMLNKTWTFWCNIDNVAAAKYYRWNGYPSYGFNVMFGLNYSF